MAVYLFWIFIILLFGFEFFLLLSLGEHIYSVRFRHQYPQVSCRVCHCRTIIEEIRKHYPNAKTAVDVGAGYGRMCRAMANVRGLKVIAIENMRFSIFVMRLLNFIFGAWRIKIIFADAFAYLGNSRKKYDIGVAYLGPAMNARLLELRKKFKVIITLDAPIPNLSASRIVDIAGGGHTHYHHIGNFPHRLFIYEFAKI